MISPITLDALRTLDAIERRQSFAAAADELFRVPSAISYTVSKLEQELGVSLFDRSRRKAELTPEGRLLLEQGRRILLATDELTALARQAAEGWETEIRIAIDTVLDPGPVWALIAQFQALQPRCEVRLLEEVLGGSWDALNSGRCDIVIGAEGAPPGKGFGQHRLGEVVFDFALPADHPLLREPRPLSPKAIAGYPTVVVADSSRELPVRSAGLLDGRSRLVVATMAHKIDAQCRGLGVGYLPRHRIGQQLTSGQLTAVPLQQPRQQQSISIAWRKTAQGKGLKWFVDRLSQAKLDPEAGLVLA